MVGRFAVFLGGWQGKKTQIAGCILGLFAVILGKFLYIYWMTPEIIKMAIGPEAAKTLEIKRSFLLAIQLFVPYLKSTFDLKDAIFLRWY